MNKRVLSIVASLACVSAASLGLTACSFTSSSGESETYTVRFDAGLGTILGDRFYEGEVEKNSTVTEPTEEPVLDDYLFIGWSVTNSSNGELWNFDTDIVTSDTTLYAMWTRACTVTFDANGGAFANGGDKYTVKVAEGSKLTEPTVTPPDSNHAIKGWIRVYYDYWDFATPVTRDIELRAEWGFTDEVEKVLAPFEYTERYGNVTVTGVKDKTVKSLVVPSVVSYIADNAFKDCAELESIVIDDSVTSIGKYAFSGCEKLKSVTLPSALRTISDYTFNGCSSLENIELPDTLTSIGLSAFMDCSALTEIEVPSGVTEISGNTFRDCASLKEVKLGSKVTDLGAYAFMGCESLEKFDIPSGVKRINGYLFYGCTSLDSIVVLASCEEIMSYAFCDSGIKSAVIHSKTVGTSAFMRCANLSELTLGDEVEELQQDAFTDCVSLTEVAIPDSVVKSYGQVFKNCTGLKTATIGAGLAEIPVNMFMGCSALRSVEFGDNIKSIRSNAFWDCVSLLSFTVPSTVTTVDSKAFNGCARLVEIYNLTDNDKLLSKPNTNTVIHTSADEESIIHTVGDFSFCIFKPNYASEEEAYLLDYSGDGESVVLPDNYEGESYKVFSYALAGKRNLKSVTFSSGVTEIGGEVLFGSDGVTTLNVASGNSALKTDGNCVIDIANKKFVLGCKTSVLPSDGSVTSIGNRVFCHNDILNDGFKIPESVTQIAWQAFDGIDGIKHSKDNVLYVDTWAVGLDYRTAQDLDLKLQAGTVGVADNTFAANTNSWAQRIKSVTTNAELKCIGEKAFYYGTFEGLTLNNGLLTIARDAFSDCAKLVEVVLPDTVTELGGSAFYGCSALKYIKLSSGLSAIKGRTFRTCGALKTVIVPTSIVEIGDSVFSSADPSVKVNATIYYEGAKEQWDAVKKTNVASDEIRTTTVICYSETAPDSGKAWHYGQDGKPTTEY